ncbi:MAG: Arc family DNA-binding protein [Oscillospiraceae bacterium]|nr:Arc family DNA-binding protein [Oscillospiraceae bacterium]
MAGNYYTPFSLRISETLLDKIKVIAKENKRSANKEMEFILEQYVARFEKEFGTILTQNTQE